MITVERYHDISMGHRVVGHEGKCKHLHGHNYRITFVVAANELDAVGRVIDFGVIKSLLCQWLEENWDHKMVLWDQDPTYGWLIDGPPVEIADSVVLVPFNPTAENIAKYIVVAVAPMELVGTGVKVISCKVEETRKCSATYSL